MRRYSLLMLPLLAGCAGRNVLDDPKGVAVEDVLRRVKAEIGLFQSHERAYIRQPPLRDGCHGYVNFYIPKVKMTLSVVLTTVTGGTATLGPPPVGDAKLGLSLGANRQGKQTQTIEFTEFPIEPLPPEAVEDDMVELQKEDTFTPMTDALDGLRNAVLAESAHGPCLDLRQGDADPKNTVSFAIEIDKKNTGGLTFAYTMFSLGGTRSGENDYTNKIEISFAPYLNPLPPARRPAPAAGHRARTATHDRTGSTESRGLADEAGMKAPVDVKGPDSLVGFDYVPVPLPEEGVPRPGPVGLHPERGRVPPADDTPRCGPVGMAPERGKSGSCSDSGDATPGTGPRGSSPGRGKPVDGAPSGVVAPP